MSVLRVCLFGKLQVQFGEHPINFNACKAEELFCYLLLYRDRSHSRETLADLLWGDSSPAHSKGYLRKALWQLQAALDLQAGSLNGNVLLVEPDWVRLNPETDLWLDLAVFEQAFTLVQSVPGKALAPQYVQTLRDAVDLYRADLLEGWYQDWCLHERERLQYMYLAMLDKLVSYSEMCYECEAGLAYGARILRYDRARERTHRRLMRLHCLGGNRTAALRQYQHCVAALDEELGVKPAKRTTALYEQIRTDQFGGPAPILAEVNAATSPLPEVLEHLKYLQAVLVNVQSQVHQYIQAVELALDNDH